MRLIKWRIHPVHTYGSLQTRRKPVRDKTAWKENIKKCCTHEDTWGNRTAEHDSKRRAQMISGFFGGDGEGAAGQSERRFRCGRRRCAGVTIRLRQPADAYVDGARTVPAAAVRCLSSSETKKEKMRKKKGICHSPQGSPFVDVVRRGSQQRLDRATR